MFGVYKTFAAVTQTTVTKRQQLCGGREKQIQTYGERETTHPVFAFLPLKASDRHYDP